MSKQKICISCHKSFDVIEGCVSVECVNCLVKKQVSGDTFKSESLRKLEEALHPGTPLEPAEKIVNVCRTEIDEMLVKEFIKFSTLMREHLTEDMSFTKGPMTISIHIRN
jgi:hypothetical protein